MTASGRATYRFNAFRVDAARRLLFGPDGRPIALSPKVFDTLLYLIERPGQLVPKQALLEGVWPHVVVEENNLNKAISTLRAVLGETRDEHRFIVTEPGRGYRFVAQLEALSADAAAGSLAEVAAGVPPSAEGLPAPTASPVPARAGRDSRSKLARGVRASVATAAACAAAAFIYWLASGPTASTAIDAAPPPNSIAVLPFDNLSPDPNDAYFAIGIHEELLSQVARIGDLHVRSRSAVMGYAGTQKPIAEIARELDVESVLDGSVRYADGRVLVTVYLTDGATDSSLWAQSYDREFGNIFAIQSDIALSVARALRAKLLPVERARVTRVPTTSLRAYDLYLSATARQVRGAASENLAGLEEIEQALALDPNFALAWMRKSNLRTIAQYFDPERGDEHRSLGEQAARVALELDPDLGSAHAALGMALANLRAWKEAEAAYRRAFDLNVPFGDPNGYAMLQMYVGNFEYAREIFEEARARVPNEATVLRFLVFANAVLGEWPTAVAQHELGMRLFNPWREAENQMRHLRIARNELEEARAIPATDPINETMLANLESPQTALRELHRLYSTTGPDNPNAWRNIALWAGHFGDAALALDAMRSAVAVQGGQLVYIWLPQLSEMRQLPEFKSFLREIGIVAYWQEYGWPRRCRSLDSGDFACD